MALSFSLSGTLNIQLTDEARPTPIPLTFSTTYSEKAIHDFHYTGAVTNQAIPQGTVTAPRLILVWVREGSITLSWAADGAGGTAIQANPTPPPTESPLMVLTGYSPSARQLYITTSGAARGSIWLFE